MPRVRRALSVPTGQQIASLEVPTFLSPESWFPMTHPCAILVKLFDKIVQLKSINQVKNLDNLVKKLVTDDAPLRHEL